MRVTGIGKEGHVQVSVKFHVVETVQCVYSSMRQDIQILEHTFKLLEFTTGLRASSRGLLSKELRTTA